MLEFLPDLILQSGRIEIVESIDVLFGILIVGFLFFGYKTGFKMFIFAAGILALFLGFAFIEESMLIFISMVGIFMTILVYTFWGDKL